MNIISSKDLSKKNLTVLGNESGVMGGQQAPQPRQSYFGDLTKNVVNAGVSHQLDNINKLGNNENLTNSVNSLKDTYSNFSSNVADNTTQGASDFNKGQQMTGKGGLITPEGVAESTKGLLKSGLRTAGDSAGAIYASAGAAIGATGIGQVFDKIGELSQTLGGKYNPIQAITDLKSVQDFVANRPNLEKDFVRALNLGLASLDTGKIDPSTVVKRTIEQFKSPTVPGTPPSGPSIDSKGFKTSESIPKTENSVSGTKNVTGPKAVIDEILPTTDRLVNFEVTRALDLTQGDVKNISQSTGNEVGQFVANKNLIGKSKTETVKNISDFFKTNYDAVRTEINNVKATYNQVEIPRYKEALTEIKKQISNTPGMQEANYEVTKLLETKNPTLADVQRVKELMDDHFSLYKMTGDVKEGVAKQGLSQIRKDLKDFIEAEVKDRSGVDIGDLNNNVQTARSLLDAIETRSTRGLTRSNLKLGDLGIFAFGSSVGSPLLGGALLLGKKIIESPTFRLNFAKWLDGLSDAQKAKVKKDLISGIVPKRFEKDIA